MPTPPGSAPRGSASRIRSIACQPSSTGSPRSITHHVRPELEVPVDRRGAIADRARNRHATPLQHRRQALSNHRVIVHQQNPDHAVCAIARTSVPSPGRLSIWRVPRIRAARSPHAGQSVFSTDLRRRVESATVVLDREPHLATFRLQTDFDACGRRMFERVGDGLLGNAETGSTPRPPAATADRRP